MLDWSDSKHPDWSGYGGLRQDAKSTFELQTRGLPRTAQSLDDGTVSDTEFRLLRALEDSGLGPEEAKPIAE